MTAFVVLLEEDLSAMMRSWTVWMWLAISGVGGLSGVVFAGTFDQESTSFIFGWFLLLYVALGSFMVMIISSASGGIDPRTLGDSIISHGVTPAQFVLSLLTSRALTVLGMSLLVITPVRPGGHDAFLDGVDVAGYQRRGRLGRRSIRGDL